MAAPFWQEYTSLGYIFDGKIHFYASYLNQRLKV